MSPTVYYILCAVLSIAVLVGISMLSKVKTAVAGNLVSATSLLLGVLITLSYNRIISVWSVYVYMLAGVLIGGFLATRVKMIQMPQLVALLNGVGGLASGLVGILSLLRIGAAAPPYPGFVNVTATLAIVVGMITLFGSLVAAGKLHKLLSQRPVVWKNHSLILYICLIILVATVIYSIFADHHLVAGYILVVSMLFSILFGVTFAIRVGGADMPITISLLNSLSGVAGAIAGMAVNDLLLVSVGGIVGASGLLLTQIMCRAMNRSLVDILTGKTATAAKNEKRQKRSSAETEEKEAAVKTLSPQEQPATEGVTPERWTQTIADKTALAATQSKVTAKSDRDILRAARSVIIVPGYGMALAQAQHLVRQLADRFEAGGAQVKYAIHPVAGRMPGHMNVLLAEADVPYEQLYEMEAVNDEFATTDVVVIIGANDVMNPAAREAEDTPIYGMPVLNVDQAKEVFICNYDLQPGYAGVENPLYTRKHGVHLLLGDAKISLEKLLQWMN